MFFSYFSLFSVRTQIPTVFVPSSLKNNNKRRLYTPNYPSAIPSLKKRRSFRFFVAFPLFQLRKSEMAQKMKYYNDKAEQ